METFFFYIGRAALATGAFLIVYLLLFQNRKQFVFNRLYLLFSMAASLVIPLVTFTSIREIAVTPMSSVNYLDLAPAVVSTTPVANPWNWYHYATLIYLAGLLGFFFYLVAGHLKAIGIIKKSAKKPELGNKVYVSGKDIHPFSFFGNIVLSRHTLSHPDFEMILTHERIHVVEKHTIDILFSELLFLPQWFNPFAWLIKDAIKNNLEYKTDNSVIQNYNPETYQLAMVSLAGKKGVSPFLNALDGSHLKNRIVMMKKKTTNKYAVVKQLVILPLLAILVMGLANREIKTVVVEPEKVYNETSAPVKIMLDGKEIPSTDTRLSHLDIEKNLDGNQVVDALGIKWEDIHSTTFDTEKGIFQILTNDFNSENGPGNLKEPQIYPAFVQSGDIITGRVISSETNSPLMGVIIFNRYGDKLATTNENGEFTLDSTFNSQTVYMVSANQQRGFGHLQQVEGQNRFADMQLLAANNQDDSANKTVKGKVTDEKGNPISGATVVVKGTTTGTVTDSKGNYFLKVKKDDNTLIFAMYGYNSQDMPINERDEIVVELKETGTKSGSNEIIIEGKKKENNPKGDSFTAKGVNGNFKGKLTKDGNTEYTGPVDFKITSKGENSPLYILDGIQATENEINNLSANDIESVHVLKNPASLAIYGEKAKNGVVIVVTKGKEKNDSSVNANDNQVFYKVEEMAEFPGGEKELNNFIQKNTRYPQSARENGIEGNVYVSFIIDKTGKVSNSKISKGVDPSLDTEALRVINSMPNWKPGKQRGKTVNLSYTVPVTFALQNSDKITKTEVAPKNVLIIVDGEEYSGDINQILPEEILKIDVIKPPFEFGSIYSNNPKATKGVVVIQTKTKYNTDAQQKGLIIVNGLEFAGNIKEIDSERIKTSYNLNAKEATSKYGEKGKNGATEIILKDLPEIKTAADLNNFLIRALRYPVAAQEKGTQGKITLWAKTLKDGKIISVYAEKPEGNIVKVKENIITAYKNGSKDQPVDDKSKLQSEALRVINTIPLIEVPEMQDKILEFNFTFKLQ